MGTIKLKRGTGAPTSGDLAQYEVAMDVAAKQLYTSTNGTDVVTLSNEYTDVDTVSAIETANLTLAGNNVAEGGFQVYASSAGGAGYNETLIAKRLKDGAGNRTIATVWRDLDSGVINNTFDDRGVSLDFNLTSDNQGTTQYLGAISMQSGSDDDSQGNWIEANSFDSSYGKDVIFWGNKDNFYTYGRLDAIQSATLTNRFPFGPSAGDGDNEAPLVVKADYENADAVAAEFWNLTNNDDNTIKIHFGTDDAGTKTYNNELRSKKDNDTKLFVMNVLNDDGTFNDTAAYFSKDTNTGEIKNKLFGQTRFEQTNTATNQDTSIFINTDMENSPVDFMNGVKTNSDFNATTLPDGAEIFQAFSYSDNTIDAAGPAHAGGYFGSRYRSANNGELTTMKLVAQTHDYTGEVAISINQKEATCEVPFKYQGYTTTARNALSVNNGSVIYNTTTDKLQVYAAGAWVDLH